ncbi:MAG TPA: hypothetical protein VFF92_03980 [Dehalococcoidales bacterium]|nr:hypothetical protein [Dehalococcoidales bacterium]
MVWIKFIVCVVVIFISGRKVARYGDIIAEKTGLGGVWVGLVLIAMLTSLPELFNGVSAVTLVDAPGLTIGNLLGANMFNLFNLTIISIDDLLYTKGPILAAVSETHLVTAFTVMLMTAVFIIGLGHRHQRFFRFSWWNITLMLLFLMGAYYSFQLA